MSVPDSLMFPKFQWFKSQNGVLVNGKAQLFYVNSFIFNKGSVPIHGMFLLRIKETAPPMLINVHSIVFFIFDKKCRMLLDAAKPTCILPT